MIGTWDRHLHYEDVWGTIVTFDLRAQALDHSAAAAACAAAAAELHRIDGWLSPFRPDSAVSAIRKGDLTRATAPAPVRKVIDGCEAITRMTGGAFDPWKAPGGFDPSGYVKGWGADRATAILLDRGFMNVSVNAAGDVTCRGRSGEDADGWLLGVADPADPQTVIATVVVRDAHLATSGRYEQGDHIVDPASGRPSTHIDSASVLAVSGGMADALATALFVRGPAALTMLVNEPISALLIAGSNAWTIGEAFARDRVGRTAVEDEHSPMALSH